MSDIHVALMVEEGEEQGIGRGQLAAHKANMIACVKVISPLLFGWLFTIGSQKGYKGLPFAFASALFLICQGVMEGMRREDWESKKEK